MENFEKLNSVEQKKLVADVVEVCHKKAEQYIHNWNPEFPDAQIIDGCAYLRLSTDKQVIVDKGSLEQQVNIAISEAVIRSKNEGVNYRITKFYIEPGITGRHDNRPQFQRMKVAIKKGTYKFVVIKELSRISRDALIWKEFFKACIKSECQIMLRGLPINPNDPAQVMHLDILAAFAEFESNQTSKRVKESVYSALVTSGKFNSTHKRLGLDQLHINGEPQVGMYTGDKEELKTVEWIMKAFVKYASYSKTIEVCNENGIENWNGESFKKNSIVKLLTDMRYIGKWEVNAENKDKDQDRLMPYDRYAEIDLPHGCIVDLDLWEQVQKTVNRISNSRDKNTRINRIYPLTGLLRFKDGSSFHGASAWKDNYKHCYYHNKTQDIRLQAEEIEKEAHQIVSGIIRNSPKIIDALSRFKNECSSTSHILEGHAERIELKIESLTSEKEKLNKRLDYILAGDDEVAAQRYRKAYLKDMKSLDDQIAEKKAELEIVQEKIEIAEKAEFDWKKVGEKAQRILEQIDPVALKNAYRSLFDCIVVGDLQKDGKTELKFVLKGEPFEFEPSVNRRKKIRDGVKLAPRARLELATG